MVRLRKLLDGCPFLYTPDGELYIKDAGDFVVCLTGESQGDVTEVENIKVYPVKVTMTYEI